MWWVILLHYYLKAESYVNEKMSIVCYFKWEKKQIVEDVQFSLIYVFCNYFLIRALKSLEGDTLNLTIVIMFLYCLSYRNNICKNDKLKQ